MYKLTPCIFWQKQSGLPSIDKKLLEPLEEMSLDIVSLWVLLLLSSIPNITLVSSKTGLELCMHSGLPRNSLIFIMTIISDSTWIFLVILLWSGLLLLMNLKE